MDHVTDAAFATRVLEAEHPVLVEFTAAWCPPCRQMEPHLAALDAERDDLGVVAVDVDAEPGLAARYGVLGMPTFVLFRHGEPVLELRGARPRKRLERELDEVLSVSA